MACQGQSSLGLLSRSPSHALAGVATCRSSKTCYSTAVSSSPGIHGRCSSSAKWQKPSLKNPKPLRAPETDVAGRSKSSVASAVECLSTRRLMRQRWLKPFEGTKSSRAHGQRQSRSKLGLHLGQVLAIKGGLHEVGSGRSVPKAPPAHSDVLLPAVPDADVAMKPSEGRGSESEEMSSSSSEGGSSFMQAMFNGVNILAGVGVLSTPYALMQGGWSSLLVLAGLASVCCYTGLILGYCLQSKPGLSSYPDIGEAAFGPLGRAIISVVLYVELYACCVEFLILEGDNLGALFPLASLDWAFLHLSSHDLFVLLSALVILPTVYLRDLSLLSYVSAGGVVASLVVFSSVASVGLTDVGFHQSGPLFNLMGMPVTIGLLGFCYSGHAVFPNIYTSMRKKEDYSKVLYTSFALCTAIYAGMAIMGFTMFGSEVETQITLNLPPELTASMIAIWTTVVNPFTKYALSMTPVALWLEGVLPDEKGSVGGSWGHMGASVAIRTGLVASTVAVALLIPFFGYVMAFIGSLMTMAVSVIFPCACYLQILGKKATLQQVLTCYSLILLGFGCGVAGTISSVDGIITSLRVKPDLHMGEIGSHLGFLSAFLDSSLH